MDGITLTAIFRMRLPARVVNSDNIRSDAFRTLVAGISPSSVVLQSEDYLELYHPCYKFKVAIEFDDEEITFRKKKL